MLPSPAVPSAEVKQKLGCRDHKPGKTDVCQIGSLFCAHLSCSAHPHGAVPASLAAHQPQHTRRDFLEWKPCACDPPEFSLLLFHSVKTMGMGVEIPDNALCWCCKENIPLSESFALSWLFFFVCLSGSGVSFFSHKLHANSLCVCVWQCVSVRACVFLQKLSQRERLFL